MEQNVTLKELDYCNAVSCNSCARHNFSESTLLKDRYTDSKMYELKARSQTTVLCEDCLHVLENILKNTIGDNQ